MILNQKKSIVKIYSKHLINKNHLYLKQNQYITKRLLILSKKYFQKKR